MRKYYWYLTAYLRKHGMIMLVTLVFAIGFFSLVLPRLITTIEQKKRTYVGIVGDYSLDTLPPTISEKISLGLTKIETNGTVSSSIADRWIAEDEGRTYRFVLRTNLVWQDGKPVTTEDVNYNFKDVEIIRTQSDVLFKLPDAYVPFPTVVAQPLIRTVQTRYLLFLSRPMPVGIGAYKVVDYKIKNNRLRELVLDHPRERIIYRFYLTEDQAVTAFKHGSVDILPDMNRKFDLETWPNTTITSEVRSDRYLAVFFNNASPLFPKNIRQGLSYALPTADEEIRAFSPIAKNSWVYLDSAKRYDYDISRGIERLLDEIPSVPLTFSLTTTGNFQSDAEQIKQYWEDFGRQAVEACKAKNNASDEECDRLAISITVKVSNFPDTTNFDALLIGQQIPADPDQYPLWHSNQNTNFIQYKNTRIDSLLERGRTTIEANERRAIYQEFQQFFLEDAPVVFLRYLESNRIERK